jgi:hypothetical protein
VREQLSLKRRYYTYLLDVRRIPAREGTFFLSIDRPFCATHLACVSRFPANMQVKLGQRVIFDGLVPERPLPLFVPLRIRRGSVLLVKLSNQLRMETLHSIRK